MEIAENWSRIRGRVDHWAPPAKPGDPGELTITVERVDDVPSPDGTRHRNLLTQSAGRTIHVVVPASAASKVDAKRGATAEIEVRRGRSADRVFAHPDKIRVTYTPD